MSVKILHCADLHLGSSYSNLSPEKRDIRKYETMESFNAIIDLCIKEKIDILLAAGDIFDTPNPLRDVVKDVLNGLSRLEKTRVFIAPGNHDPYTSVYSEYEFPANVHIFKDPECVTVESVGARVYGAGFADRFQRESLMKGLRADSGEYINLCVMHGDLNVSSSEYNPISAEDIKNSGFNYTALGHIHMYSGIKREGAAVYAYSGTNEGHGFDETGGKGVIIGEVTKAGANLRFLPMNKRKYFNLSIDVSGAYSDESAAETIKKAVLATDDEPQKHFYKITMTGKTDKDCRLNPATVSRVLKRDGYDICEVSDRTAPDYNIDELARQIDIRGIFTRIMLEKAEGADSDEDREIYQSALRTGLRAFDGGVEYIEDYTDKY